MKSGKQVQHRINCTNGTAMQIGAVMQQTGRYESDWDTVFTWTRRNGLVISPLGMNWLKLHKKVLIKTELTVVSIIAVPFTYMAKQYEHWDDHGHYKCSSGVPCKFKKVFLLSAYGNISGAVQLLHHALWGEGWGVGGWLESSASHL